MALALLALGRAIGDLVASPGCTIDDAVAALGVLRSIVFDEELVLGDRDASRLGNIAQLADVCAKERRENVLLEPEFFDLVAKFLLYKVAPDWLACFTTDQRKSLFDAFFLAGRSSEVLMVLVPALGTECTFDSELDESERASVCAQAERLLVRCFVENPGVQKMAEEFCDSNQTRLRKVAQLVSSVPDRVLPKAHPSLKAQSFLSSVVSQLVSAAKEHHGHVSADVVASAKFLFIGEVLSKLCRRGYAGIVAAELVLQVSDFVQTLKSTPKEFTCWQAIVMSMKDFYAIERMSEAVLYKLNDSGLSEPGAYFVLYALFGDPLSHATVRSVFADRFLLWKVFPLRILIWIVHFSVLCICDNKKNVQKDIVRFLAEAWADKTYVQAAPIDRQAYVTAALGISLKAMTKEEISETDNLLRFILDGVSKRLDSPLPHVRRMAKQIALVYSIVINPENPLLLDDGDTTESLQSWDVPSNLAYDIVPQTATGGRAVAIDDPDAIVDFENLEQNQGNEDSDSEASLKPYDMSDDEADLDKEKYPSQLSSCAASLRKGDDPDAAERALDVCEKFIRLVPDELENSAADLAKALVHMRSSSLDDSMEIKRHRALVALLVCAPLTSADVLTKELYSVHVDVSQRLMILDVLAEAAQELASGAETNNRVPLSAGPWTEASRPLVGDSLISWGPTYERELPPKPGQRELGKSRRWGKRSLELQMERLTSGSERFTSKRNRFAPFATAFMVPVLRDYDKKRSGLDMLGTDFIILARLIIMLGICMQCLSFQPDVPAIAPGLLDMLRSRHVYKHPEAYVRRAALFAASRVLVALHPSHLAAHNPSIMDGLEWLREWSLEVSSSDPDSECVKMAVACLHIHSDVAFQTSRSLEPCTKSSLIRII